ncbi:hypothetical protein Ocin01_05239 [Orchesella cincta]|uniref:Uncharacterized protein n=1 Tax=Orchesella cincta TaxID=48709 RepID=A0A1D2N845_ORCCI|nr:hypothetical protein Ocin01_05239 [Orchesella cincta]
MDDNSNSSATSSMEIDMCTPCHTEQEHEVVVIIESTDDSDPDDLAGLSCQVFQNEMLRELILSKVIWQTCDKCSVAVPDLCSLRLVRKDWLLTVSTLMRKAKLPMYKLKLNNDNSTSESVYCQKNGKLLSNFVASMTDESRIEDYIPSFNMKLMPSFFRRENYDDLSTCMVQCGASLLNLQLSFPINSTMTFVFHPFRLPKLKTVSVQFSDERLVDYLGLQNNAHTIYPLQTILNATDELYELQFQYTRSTTLTPFGFEYLTVPSTITKLLIDCPLKNSDLELLKRNDLPNLVHLRLHAIAEACYRDGLIFDILSKLKRQLQILNLRGNQYPTRVRSTTMFSFPVMEKLTTLTVTSQCWELEDNLDSVKYEEVLPALKELRILHQTKEMFAKWTANSVLESVTSLFVALINPRNNTAYMMHPTLLEEPLTLTLERMQSLHMTFPNVVCLEVAVCGPEVCGLQYLFMEMRNLQKVAITVKGSMEGFQHAHWDALLIGAPRDLVISLKRNRDFWSNVELKDDNNFPSIRKLAELRSLAIVEHHLYAGPHQECTANVSLLSDMTFYFAFLRMPNLKQLLLSPKFMPSPEMAQQWKEEKGNSILSIPRQ